MIVINQPFINRTSIVDFELEWDTDSMLEIQPRQKKTHQCKKDLFYEITWINKSIYL